MTVILQYETGVFILIHLKSIGELYPVKSVRISGTFVGSSMNIVYVYSSKHTLGKRDSFNFPSKNTVFP